MSGSAAATYAAEGGLGRCSGPLVVRRSRPLDRTTTKRNPSEDEIAADAFGPKETKHLEECGVKTSNEDASEEG